MTHTFLTSKAVSPPEPGSPHIILVGLPGAGKSTVGRLLGETLKRAFLDFDAEIEQRVGMSVAAIFAERGEAGFRRLERQLTEDVARLGNMVLAPGGGWVSDPAVVGLVRPPGVVVYLRTRPEQAVRRLGPGAGGRPLLNRPGALQELARLYESRRLAYESADVEVATELLTPQQVAAEVAARLAGRLGAL